MYKRQDGHGGIYESLVKSGMTEKMRQLGIKWVFIGGVDNLSLIHIFTIIIHIIYHK